MFYEKRISIHANKMFPSHFRRKIDLKKEEKYSLQKTYKNSNCSLLRTSGQRT